MFRLDNYTNKGVSQSHVDRDVCKGSTDTPKETTL
ncbi:MAG: hypothetical protein AMDU4_FER2C00067G0003 [Ferroplasma sp. Type II]|nr:MAG: hypothetical protein AMDU4_FER2C00067G0003 [Ferroplasma sp. Type II]